MTTIDSFYRNECEKIDPLCIDASLSLKLGDDDPSILTLENPWGDTSIDLEPAVKDAETVTHLKLSPEDTPVYLEYDNESGARECIHGDELSRIISMTKLKDVDQDTAIADGYVYIYDGNTNLFVPYDLKALENRVTSLEERMTAAETNIKTMQQQIAQILAILTPPSPIPNDTRLVWGNINVYGDTTNSGLKTSGLYTHGTDTDKTNDQMFS